MKRKSKNRILSVILAAAMVLGNIGVPQGTEKVQAASVNLEELTRITDEDITEMYHDVAYASQAVHDPSILKVGDEYYVFGTQRAIAKTSNLREWSSVAIDGLFANCDGQIVSVDAAFSENAFHGNITTALSDQTRNLMSIVEEETTEEETTEEETTVEDETEDETSEYITEEETAEEETTEAETAAEESSETEESENDASEDASEEETMEEETIEIETSKVVLPQNNASKTTDSEVELLQKETATETTNEFTSSETVLGTEFGYFDAAAWNLASEGLEMSGNLWAPDIIYNPTLNQYCMYLSLNGNQHNSVIVLMTADNAEGPYVYQGPVVYSGFTAQEDVPTNWQATDITYALGSLESLPERYQKITDTQLNSDGKITGTTSSWGDYWPHAIDPCVFYDEDDKLWMAYGSWSGGIYMLELDETTGLRDYTTSYESDYDAKGKSVTSDPYFGTKIAGGYYVSGEGSYIEKIGEYYYLFMSYGFYAPNGGYAMRVFRSKNPNGPFTDTNGISAVYDSFKLNYTADWGSIADTRGMRLMPYYKWDYMSKGEVAQGHNSAFVDDDGRAYLVYHTKFDNNTVEHEVRVHELFQNQNGWILASPFAYAGDEALNYQEEPVNVEGDYEIMLTEMGMGYDSDSGTATGGYTGPLAEISTISLETTGTITKDSKEVGTWEIKQGTPYATIILDDITYSGVFVEATKDTAGVKTMCFTVLDETSGVSLWGARKLEGAAVIADNVMNPTYLVPSLGFSTLTLPTETQDGTTLYWESANTTIVSDEGIINNRPQQDTSVTFTMTMVSGDYYYQKDYPVTIAGTATLDSDRILIGTAYTNSPQDLTGKNNGSLSMVNPFYKINTEGLSFTEGVSIEFDAAQTGSVTALGALFAFQDSDSGKLYFTQGSYLGYNAEGGYYDANLNNYSLVTDYIGDATAISGNNTAHVRIDLNPDGFAVYVDDTLAYNQDILTTENGAASITEYYKVLDWLQSKADTLYLGYGAWWSDSVAASVSNFEFYVNQCDDEAAVDYALASLEGQIPTETESDITLPDTGLFSTQITWKSSDESVLAINGTVTTPSKDTKVILTATVQKGEFEKSKKFTVTVTKPITSNAMLERDSLSLTSADQIAYIENPFYGKNFSQLLISYDITWDKQAWKTGYDGLFAFYKSETGGRVSIQSNPYICYNAMLPEGQDNVWLDILGPAEYPSATNLETGKKYSFDIALTKESCTVYLDGEKTLEMTSPTSGTNFEDVLVYIAECDQMTWGVGNCVSAFWSSELSTLENITISTENYTKISTVKEDLTENDKVEIDNPLYEQDLQEVVLDFVISYADNAYMEGWQGLMSFYNPSSGNSTGRVSIQNAPYLCYNDGAGNWMDINNPNTMVANNLTVPVTTLNKGTDYHYEISIMADKVTMKLDGSMLELAEASSGSITYQELLDYIASCKTFSWGADFDNCYWGKDSFTLKDAKVVGYVKIQQTIDAPTEDSEPDTEEDDNQGESNPGNTSENNNSSNYQTSTNPVQNVLASVAIAPEQVPLAEQVSDTGNVTVELDEQAKLRAQLLQRYHGRNLYLMAHLGNGIGYTIDASNIQENAEDLLLNSSLLEIADFAEGFTTFHLHPHQEAALTYAIGVHMNVGGEYAGKQAYIFCKSMISNEYYLNKITTINEIGNTAVLTTELTDIMVLILN